MMAKRQNTHDSLSHSLTVSGLSCIRDDRTLFRDLNFALNQGQVLLIEGRNGSGKTSLLRILCGIRRQDAGSVEWNGETIEKLGVDYREEMTYVGHQNGLKDLLTARENLQMSRALGKANSRTFDAVLDEVGLINFDDAMAQSLSAGQRRRLALARLLVTNSLLWILDEPFTAIDTAGIKNFEKLFQQHLEAGGMLVMTSHHQVDIPANFVQRVNLSE